MAAPTRFCSGRLFSNRVRCLERVLARQKEVSRTGCSCRMHLSVMRKVVSQTKDKDGRRRSLTGDMIGRLNRKSISIHIAPGERLGDAGMGESRRAMGTVQY